ncbi:MAG: hypothetical protein KJO08_09220 [Gammaproteobacteria bacterium]|nr:hypothetical protein [Gammaproteobacteria bacterium]
MGKAISFNELLEAAEHLPLDTQESFIDVLRHRIAEHRRQEIHTLVLSAREEYSSGKLTPQTPQDIMQDILS